jgi:hypothetical protein
MSLMLFSDKILQKSYLEKIYSNIDKKFLQKFDFLVISSHPNDMQQTLEMLYKSKNKKIIFDLADEWHRVPFYYNNTDVELILKEFSPQNYEIFNKLIPLPVYYNYKKINQIPIDNRKLFLYSNMWLTPSRMKLKEIFDNYKNESCSITWNTDFAKGVTNEEYLKNMSDALVTICPTGYISPEVAKIGEGLMCGNIIISSKKPNYPYYKDNSFFIYEDEREIPEILNHIQKLSSQEKQNIIDKNNFMFNTKYCPEAIANILNERIHLCVS